MVAKELNGRGFHDLAWQLDAATFKNFAKWRWGTLHAACKAIMALSDLRGEFCGDMFSNCLDLTMISDVVLVFSGHRQFWIELFYVNDIMTTVNYIRTWGSGCQCHEQELMAGRKVVL